MVEQLWTLSITDLKNAIKALKELIKKTDDSELSFLEDNNVVDEISELKFNILKDIYLTKVETLKALQDAATRKENNQKILQLIASKQDEELAGKSVAELEAMLQ